MGRRDVEVARAWLVANELVGNSTPGRPWPVGLPGGLEAEGRGPCPSGFWCRCFASVVRRKCGPCEV